ncbi:hypothetical protein O6H91_14G015600 [Diphasiastrum complanatum]|uniref:Uncharacterized protein n=2 Tax=Diphasiastrum complanatum TaxID=34168 RepID=A0ACC2BLR7_DIPCM|nr:hypothetical protein O6H91_14G015400 [Diphasiastrum complanatum]KAJ7530704.1 hypothetical protein O6H91_14G015600 [Diphasiastrum complanatum]
MEALYSRPGFDRKLNVVVLGAVVMILLAFPPGEAFDPLDPNGNITIKWDVMTWTGDGYMAQVTMYNYQQYRHIEAPGWILGWAWAKKEVIWSMQGAEATMQGDCSKFHGDVPHCCKKDPTIVDLLPGVAYSAQSANCCRGGVLSSYVQDPLNSVASFQIVVGKAGTSNITVALPKNFTLTTPGPGYTCSPAKVVKPSLFPTPDGRRHTQALMTWNLTCTYSQFLAQRAPTCCVSLSTFYNDVIVPCQNCACACRPNISQPLLSTVPMCVDPEDVFAQSTSSANQRPGASAIIQNQAPPTLLYCSMDMCPIHIHWHVKTNYVDYWRAKVSIINRHVKNYTMWNLVVQHPNFNNLTETFSFQYKGLTSYGAINDTAMFWGIKYYNDMLLEAGDNGNVQSEILMRKDPRFTFTQGWAIPHRILFNGDECVMPPPTSYPFMPNGSIKVKTGLFLHVVLALAVVYLATVL